MRRATRATDDIFESVEVGGGPQWKPDAAGELVHRLDGARAYEAWKRKRWGVGQHAQRQRAWDRMVRTQERREHIAREAGIIAPEDPTPPTREPDPPGPGLPG